MVVKNLTVTPARVAKVKNFTFREGERSCLVIGGGGMPLYYPNLYLTTQVRNSSRSSSTLTNSAGHLCAFLQAMDEAGVDLLARMSAGYVLEPFEAWGDVLKKAGVSKYLPLNGTTNFHPLKTVTK